MGTMTVQWTEDCRVKIDAGRNNEVSNDQHDNAKIENLPVISTPEKYTFKVRQVATKHVDDSVTESTQTQHATK